MSIQRRLDQHSDEGYGNNAEPDRCLSELLVVLSMNTNPEVDSWFAEYEHPAKDAMQMVREIVLSDHRMTETIKWKSPTFTYQGNMVSFNPRTKSHVSLMFHTDASIPATTHGWKVVEKLHAT